MAFCKIANLIDLYDGCRVPARAGSLRLLLIQYDGKVNIVEDRCPHMDAPLSTGKVVDGRIVCRAHGIGFSLSSGKAEGPLSSSLDCLKFYDPVYESGSIGIDL